jgi:hypothetical protein
MLNICYRRFHGIVVKFAQYFFFMTKWLMFFSIIFVLNVIVVTGQDIPIAKNSISMGYFGQKIFHPGFYLAMDRTLLVSKGNNKVRLLLGGSVSNYYHSKNHSGLRITPKFSIHHVSDNGFEMGIKVDAGYLRRFYLGKVYEVTNYGSDDIKYFLGQNSISFGSSLILAKNWYTTNSKNIRCFMEFGVFTENLKHSYTVIHPSFTLGLSRYLTK